MYTFKNAYVNYARFHIDQINVLIHIIFIPTLMTTQSALFYMWAPRYRDLKYSSDTGSFEIGLFDKGGDSDYILGFYEIFTLWLALVYLRCDKIIGIFGTLVMISQNRLVKFLYMAD